MLDKEYDESFGGIVFYREKDKIFYLLLKHTHGGHWDLAKGHPIEGETPQETASREIVEESGISLDKLKFIKKLEHKNEYEVWYKRYRIPKFVHLFLVESKTKDIMLSDEHDEFGWFTFEQVKEKLTFDTPIPGFIEAEEYLTRKYENR